MEVPKYTRTALLAINSSRTS